MICPLMSIAYMKDELSIEKGLGECWKDKCAWWVYQEIKDLSVSSKIYYPNNIDKNTLVGACAIAILAMRSYK